MVARLNNITFVCEEPVELAEFWRQALGYEHIETPPGVLAEVERAVAAGDLDPTGWAMLVNPDGTGPRLLFQRRPKGSTTDIPIHLDLHADDRAAEVDRLAGIGARVVEERSQKIGPYEESFKHTGTGLILSPSTQEVMKDPEGNGFCLS